MIQKVLKGSLIAIIMVFAYMHTASSVAEKSEKQNAGLSIKEYNIKTSNNEKLVFVYFNADWCVPCIKLKPIIEEIEKESKDKAVILKLDVDENPQISTHFEINTLPQFMLYKKGKAVWTHTGLLSKQELQIQINIWSEKKN